MSKFGADLKSWATDQATSLLVLTTLTILLSIALSELLTRFGWLTLALALLVVVVLYSVLSFLVFQYVSKQVQALRVETPAKLQILSEQTSESLRGLQAHTEQSTRQIKEMIRSEAHSGIDWVWSIEQLADFEMTTNSPEIWLISPDLAEDLDAGPFNEVVERNLVRGVKYRIFVPENDIMRARVQQLKRQHPNHTELHVYFLSDEFFFLVRDFDFVLYNPYREIGTPCLGYMGLPLSPNRGRYMVEISDELAATFVGRLQNIAPLA